MKLLQLVGVICISLVMTSCASTQEPKTPEIQLPPKRIVQKGYSLMPLNEAGWIIAGRDDYQLTIITFGYNTDETYAIQAIPFRLPAFKTSEEFVRLVKEGQLKDTDPARFRIKKHDVALFPGKGTDCVRSHMVTEDLSAIKSSGRSGGMILEALALTCAHPKDKKVGISVIFSQRYFPGERDPAIIEKATSVLNSVEFTDL